MTILTPASVFRKYETDGVPSSGKHEPKKNEIVQLLEQMSDAGGAKYSVATKADLEAITPAAGEQPRGEVLDDATASNNGWYVWDSDASAWVFERGFPDTFARVTLSGTGTAQAGTVGAGVNPADIEVFFAKVATDNTGAMTLSIGGETARDVVNVAGNALSAGEWTGVVMFFLNDDGKYQLLIDAGAAAAAAQSASDAHDDRVAAQQALVDLNEKYLGAYADDTAATAAANGTPVTGAEYWNTTDGKRRTWDGSAWQDTGTTLSDNDVTEVKFARGLSARVGSMFDTVADLIADEVLSYSNVSGNDLIEAEGFRYKVAASDATDHDVETAGGVKLWVLPDGNGWLPFHAFGPAGDGSTDDGPKLLAAMTAAVSRGIPTLSLGIGEYAINSKITLPGPLEVRGTNEWERGSNLPATALIWTGGADSMFTYASSEDRWIGFAILNKGSATDFIEYTSGAIRHYFEDVSGDLPTGYTAFSRSVIRSTGHRMGYSLIWHVYFTGGCAPRFIDIDGLAAGLGITPFSIGGRSIFGGYNAGGSDSFTIVKVKDCPIDGIKIDDCTFNAITGEVTIVDSNSNGVSDTIGWIKATNIEIDSQRAVAGDRFFKLYNVKFFDFDGYHINGGGQIEVIAEIQNTNFRLGGGYAKSINGYIIKPIIEGGYGHIAGYIHLNGVTGAVYPGLVYPSYTWAAGANSLIPNDTLGTPNGIHEYRVNGGDAWSIALSGARTRGQIITLIIANIRASASVDPPTMDSDIRTAGAMTMPAAGHRRSWSFYCDGVRFYEISRSAADVAN